MKNIFYCLFFIFSSHSYSQCCSTGCSMSGTKSFGVNEKNHLQVISFYKHSYSDRYFNGDSPADFKYITSSYFDYAGVDISYGITSTLTVGAQMGYYMNKTQNYNPELPIPIHTLTGHGPTDLTLLGKYNITSSDSVWSIIFSGGIKLPTGTFNEYSNDVLLPIDVQSGTGAFAGIGAITVMVKPYKKKKFNLIFNRKEVMEGAVANGYHKGYRYGFATTNSIATSFKLFKGYSFLIMVQNENRARDYDSERTPPEIDYSGFIKVSAIPGIIREFRKEWSLGAYFDYPFYQKYNGIQFGNKYAVSATISKTFGLHKEKS